MEFTKSGGNRKPVTIAVVGAGLRGQQYARLAEASGAGRVVAVAEPDAGRRAAFAARHDVAAAFTTWEDLAAAGRIADVAVVATQDRLHVGPAVALAGLGYHLLLEKPMAPTEAEARRIADAVAAAGVIGAVCHVLRYTSYTRALRALLTSGRIGALVSVQHLEPVGWWHQAHSFVRGNWRREADSGPMLLTKSCHDLDWLAYVVGAAPRSVASFGGLAHFRPEHRPAGAGERCVACAVEAACPYSAVRLYTRCLDDAEEWPLNAVTTGRTHEAVLLALRDGPYGRCVYGCDNDVVDHQVVALQYDSGVTATFTMTAFTPMQRRQTRLFGTHGSVDGDGRLLRVTDFRTGAAETIDTQEGDGGAHAGAGHDGGDASLVAAFLAAVAAGDPALLSSDMATSLASHRVVWAAERARTAHTVVTL
ncbi:Gfo/Idh/MocA family oxidoreductase [Dactylosporangium aurantiacum]|uniref:Gfo/Idh/MocA family oxidoreductase n=1 Tax=Dactylosporangium aurantiacum TaxID=35754 RepID=A0A9Q9MMD1_9ACTN|nr:Gfo/Idh/MocA family oxidoreductase [Dactylosporangium aurantiacum]MDG6105815.1 Gfo/Idh/MocA family oxidoreductase [Dactylosporangium aurantiacum]UWZ58001.1 Gfo/Idh/MocA family oxidoreductase [Dactylosporangium aurantiacum]